MEDRDLILSIMPGTKNSAAEIKFKLATDDKWLYRGILAIYKRQTQQEKSIRDTVEDNGVGFSGTDGRTMSEIAELLLLKGSLDAYTKKRARARMLKYSNQLAAIAKSN